MRRAEELALMLRDRARDEDDLVAAKLLEDLGRVFDASREVVMAKTHEHRNAAYAELVDIFKGKRND